MEKSIAAATSFSQPTCFYPGTEDVFITTHYWRSVPDFIMNSVTTPAHVYLDQFLQARAKRQVVIVGWDIRMFLHLWHVVQSFPSSFILINISNGDYSAPYLTFPNTQITIARQVHLLLTNPLLIRFYSRNVSIDHPKMVCIPTGIKSQNTECCDDWHGENGLMQTFIRALAAAPATATPFSLMQAPHRLFCTERTENVLCCFNVHTTQRPFHKFHANHRIHCRDTLAPCFEMTDPTLSMDAYLTALQTHRFCICPPGNGVDTHRVWEALLFGCIPIVFHSASCLEPVLKDLPCLVVYSWSEIAIADKDERNQWFEKQYQRLRLQHDTYKWEKLFHSYWTSIILSDCR